MVYKHVLSAGVALVVTLNGCHGNSQYEYCMKNPEVGECVLGDTEETLWPDPVERQAVRLRTLRPRIQEYVAKTGSLPEAIRDLESDPKAVDLLRDVWGQPIVYVRSGSAYELRSSGPDRQLGTPDDIIVEGP